MNAVRQSIFVRGILTIALITLTVISAVGCGTTSKSSRLEQTGRFTAVSASDPSFNAVEIYKRVSPGVVTVVSVFDDSGISRLGGAAESQTGIGSGFVVNTHGDIITNAHVVRRIDDTSGSLSPAKEVYVEFGDSNQVPATVVGVDPNADIALLRVKPNGLKLVPVPFGDSNHIHVGIPVAAIGSPFNERQSLSIGVVSAIDRSVRSLTNFMITGAVQTDAAINPGNSGGPLVNGRGQVIGVNQQIKSATGGGEGVGFAVPIDMVKRSYHALAGRGQVDYAFLGVSTTAVFPQLAQRFKLPVRKGAAIAQITPGGPAAKAGLRAGRGAVRFQAQFFAPGGDVITKVGDTQIDDPADLSKAVGLFAPGKTVKVELWRDSKRISLPVTLGRRSTKLGDSHG